MGRQMRSKLVGNVSKMCPGGRRWDPSVVVRLIPTRLLGSAARLAGRPAKPLQLSASNLSTDPGERTNVLRGT